MPIGSVGFEVVAVETFVFFGQFGAGVVDIVRRWGDVVVFGLGRGEWIDFGMDAHVFSGS